MIQDMQTLQMIVTIVTYVSVGLMAFMLVTEN